MSDSVSIAAVNANEYRATHSRIAAADPTGASRLIDVYLNTRLSEASRK
jgi:hypothetical protein